MESSQLKKIIEAALLASGGPLTIGQLQALFGDKDAPEKAEIREVIKELYDDYEGRGIEIREVASGFRVQVRDAMSPWLSKLWEDRPPRYSRALMETLAIVAYRQPVTRGDIEDIRGVSVTSNIIRTLLEREWIKVVGHRDVPGKPAMFGSTRNFLDYFGLKKLDDLPPLAELAELEPVGVQLELESEHQAAEGQVADEALGEAAGSDESAEGDALAADADANAVEGESDSLDDNDGDADGLDDFDDEEDIDLTDEELAAAQAKIDEITAELAGTNDGADRGEDVPPGAVQPLVGLNPPGEASPEPATVTSLDDARAAADKESEQESSSESPDNAQSADVVPINKS